MRGKAGIRRSFRRKFGITPAYAGKRQQLEYNTKLDKGSPPPMRGKVNPKAPYAAICGITPAYAGKRAQQDTSYQHV